MGTHCLYRTMTSGGVVEGASHWVLAEIPPSSDTGPGRGSVRGGAERLRRLMVEPPQAALLQVGTVREWVGRRGGHCCWVSAQWLDQPMTPEGEVRGQS
jgi:hypothetical protein